MRVPRPNPLAVSTWAVWSLPGRVLGTVVAVVLLTAAVLVLQVLSLPAALPPNWGWTLVVLAVAAVIGTEASLGTERRRRRTDSSPHIDLSSVWTFAAAALLPGALAAVVVVIVYGHLYARAWRPDAIPPHRVVFSAAAIVLSVQAAAVVVAAVDPAERFRSLVGLLVVALALLAYAAVNMLLVVGVMVPTGTAPDMATFRRLLGPLDEAVLEFATLSMGALAAGAMAAFGPAYAAFVLPTLFVLHRTVLVRQLEEAVDTDGKTGLLNSAGWHVRATRALRRSELADAQATVLVLDIDHFKQVNDDHGHLVGDQVLAAVAAAVKAEVREEDLVGRFGGEEFVVLLAGLDGDHDPAAARTVAERIRQRIADLRVVVEIGEPPRQVEVGELTVSIGGATFPSDGSELVQLVEGADTAMYAAKRAGRNKVRIGVEPVAGAGAGPLPLA
ncbi:GGDEF domain-containing protein [Pseudonocardia humida]|uniref:GGDEF domain-containing protein n=1 Tax=Pseudonocardia humida TaxID=2800819 RepID=A0ABT1A2K4_9PSEU|nr:GGDEF domain-containing protein [Pseudonocardia humida]MCO1657225.1 GGDEF domain-containing protein [Pseudonocardia humida]